MKKLGIARHKGQTPQEFAATAERRLLALEYSSNIAAVPPRIAAVFYRVRFGRTRLDAAETQAIASDLEDLTRKTQLSQKSEGKNS